MRGYASSPLRNSIVDPFHSGLRSPLTISVLCDCLWTSATHIASTLPRYSDIFPSIEFCPRPFAPQMRTVNLPRIRCVATSTYSSKCLSWTPWSSSSSVVCLGTPDRQCPSIERRAVSCVTLEGMEVERLRNVSDSGSGSGSSVAGFASCQRPSLRSSSGTVAVVMVASPAPTAMMMQQWEKKTGRTGTHGDQTFLT